MPHAWPPSKCFHGSVYFYIHFRETFPSLKGKNSIFRFKVMLSSFLNSRQNCSKNRPVGMTSQGKYVEAACSGPVPQLLM